LNMDGHWPITEEAVGGMPATSVANLTTQVP
jgi:hypothetical protein